MLMIYRILTLLQLANMLFRKRFSHITGQKKSLSNQYWIRTILTVVPPYFADYLRYSASFSLRVHRPLHYNVCPTSQPTFENTHKFLFRMYPFRCAAPRRIHSSLFHAPLINRQLSVWVCESLLLLFQAFVISVYYFPVCVKD